MTATTFAKLPIGVTIGAMVTLTDDTVISPSESGVNARKSLRSILRQYTCSIEFPYFAEVQSIIMSHRGRRYPFSARDWMSYQITDQVCASESTTVFKLQKLWQPSSGGRTFAERILITDTSEVAFTVEVNGSPMSAGSDYTLIDFGKIEFAVPLNPETDVVTASGQYLKAVVFAENSTAHITQPDQITFQDIRLNEISEAELTNLLA